jgi:hypothetical protein
MGLSAEAADYLICLIFRPREVVVKAGYRNTGPQTACILRELVSRLFN